jgi:adenylate cyclase
MKSEKANSTEDRRYSAHYVAESVAEKLKIKLLPKEKARVERKPTDNLEAYNLYLQGIYYWRQFTEDGATKARPCFTLAIEKDPNFALAYAELANTYGWAADLLFAPRDAMPKVKNLAEHALTIDNTLGEAHGSLVSGRRA